MKAPTSFQIRVRKRRGKREGREGGEVEMPCQELRDMHVVYGREREKNSNLFNIFPSVGQFSFFFLGEEKFLSLSFSFSPAFKGKVGRFSLQHQWRKRRERERKRRELNLVFKKTKQKNNGRSSNVVVGQTRSDPSSSSCSTLMSDDHWYF